MTTATNINDYEAITALIQHYVKGAMSGKGAEMKPAFHDDATWFGYVGADLISGPIEGLFDWNDSNGPAKDMVTKITHIEVVGSVATARVEADNWTGHRFTDFFNLLKIGNDWKIVNKVFYLHA
jgi:hypothetical protein